MRFCLQGSGELWEIERWTLRGAYPWSEWTRKLCGRSNLQWGAWPPTPRTLWWLVARHQPMKELVLSIIHLSWMVQSKIYKLYAKPNEVELHGCNLEISMFFTSRVFFWSRQVWDQPFKSLSNSSGRVVFVIRTQYYPMPSTAGFDFGDSVYCIREALRLAFCIYTAIPSWGGQCAPRHMVRGTMSTCL